jgi:hypothetical protein
MKLQEQSVRNNYTLFMQAVYSSAFQVVLREEM